MSKADVSRFAIRLLPLGRTLRPHQWVKNLLLFVPLVLAHEFRDVDKLFQTIFGCLAFAAIASAIYLINDVADAESDRLHPVKRNRPVASGEVSVSTALIASLLLILFSGGVAYLLVADVRFTALLGCYLLVTSLYSLWLKRVALLDVFVLASLYTLRLFAGGVAADVQVSKWLLAFSSFIFSSLAFVKRYAELRRVKLEGRPTAQGRGYLVGDISLVENMGVVSGYLSVLVLALYINGQDVQQFYDRPRYLWLLCPLLMYWISRIWMLAKRNVMHEDPVVFASTDPTSWLIGACAAGMLLLAA